MILDQIENPSFIVGAFAVQVLLIVYFFMRKTRKSMALRYGWLVYAAGVPALGLSAYQYAQGAGFSFWAGGVFYAVWAMFGYWADRLSGIPWRSPPKWLIFAPYLILYLATNMFYWWPVGLIDKTLWYLYAALFALSTYLNATSHR